MDAACPVSVSVSVASVTSPEYGRTGYTKSISIPMTARNRELMGDCEQLMARDRFNASLHTARLEQEGCVIMEGACHAHGLRTGGGGGPVSVQYHRCRKAVGRACHAAYLLFAFPPIMLSNWTANPSPGAGRRRYPYGGCPCSDSVMNRRTLRSGSCLPSAYSRRRITTLSSISGRYCMPFSRRPGIGSSPLSWTVPISIPCT